MKAKLDYHQILDEAPDAICIINNQLIIIDVNMQMTILSGYSKNELFLRPLAELFDKESLAEKPFKINEIENNETIFLERCILTKSGKKISVEMKSKKLPDGNYFSIIRDISDRIKARIELQNSYEKIKINEFRFRNLFNNIPLGIFIVNKNGTIEGINNSMAKILGAPSPEISKKYNIFELPTLKNTELLADIKRCFNEGTSFHKVYNYTSVWKKELFVRVHILPAEKSSNNKVLSIVEDYTEQKKKELQLKILSEGINRTPACVVVTNKDGEIIFVNEKFHKLTGYSLDEIMGKTPRILKSGHHSNEFYQNLWNTILAGKSWTGELFNKKKDGTFYWESTMITPIKNELGEITHFMAIKEDITEKKKVEAELKKAKEKAEESDRLKSSFLANMSHEIRTPLNAILGFTSLIRDYELAPEKSIKFLDLIQINSKQLLNIIDDILLISKLQINEIKLSPSVFLLCDFFQDLFETFNREIYVQESKNISLLLDIPDMVVKLEADKNKLAMVFSKLIRNAIKFTEQGTITIGYKLQENRKFVFFVKDTGIGISKEKQQIIFLKFRQVDDTKTRKYGGTGLGLSIVKALIDLMQGQIWLQSSEGAGAHFYFSIPVSIIDEKEESENKKEQSWQNKTILIVDDVYESVLLINEILKSTGVKIITASDGIEAIEKVMAATKIDLVLMDLQLPRLNGIQAAKKIRSLKNIPIIVQSAFKEEDYRQQCKKAGCNDYIQKPINPDELMHKIANLL
ncbi:MAG: PAS domain S-box protein [Bacteroidales bacterium]|nr:PAS domain S-box protein [Bacteroidales bacterium]